MEKFDKIAQLLEISPEVEEVYAVFNYSLVNAFTSYRTAMTGKHEATGDLFKRSDWNDQEQQDVRQKLLDLLDEKLQAGKFIDPDSRELPLFPVVQGTSEAAVWSIFQNGFGATATTDDGYYGRGMYFSSAFRWAAKYARPDDKGRKPFLICLTIPGNPYPVTELPYLENGGKKTRNRRGFLGKACQAGYQSHYTIVQGDEGFPVQTLEFDRNATADELVVFEAAQVLPLFVFYHSTENLVKKTFEMIIED